MKPIAVFYHCLFYLADGEAVDFKPRAADIVVEQMAELKDSGLLGAASEMVVGVNGGRNCYLLNHGDDSELAAKACLPTKAKVVFHGLRSRSENLTLVELEKWLPTHPGWLVLYFHAKGATHTFDDWPGRFASQWRRCMMRRCVTQWRPAIQPLSEGYDATGCHWHVPNDTQRYFAGNFWWATSDYLATLPSIFERDRIKFSGIESLESRFESEVWMTNGKRPPRVKDLEPTHGLWQCP